MPFLLIDCAGLPGGEGQILKDLFSEVECLFTGDLAVELADVGPYLGRLALLNGESRSSGPALRESRILMPTTASPP